MLFRSAQPVRRSAIFWGRFLAWLLSLVVILVLGYAGVMFATTYSLMELDALITIRPFASMFALLLFFAGFALLLSMLLPSRRSASMLAGILLVGGFFVDGLSGISDTLEDIVAFIPNHYYQGSTWAESFEPESFAILAGFGLVFTLVAWFAFLQRDIRLGGEGGWKLPLPKFMRRGASEA